MALSNLLNQYPPVLSVKQVAEILAVSQNKNHVEIARTKNKITQYIVHSNIDTH